MMGEPIKPGQLLAAMRDTAPLVQNITNFVAMNVMANVMLAAGASPAMVHAEVEAAEFTAMAHALTINIGTLSPAWTGPMLASAAAANSHDKPWVFDPVAAGATAYRREVSAKLLLHKPSVTRGNASEIMALSGLETKGRGADSVNTVTDAVGAAIAVNKLTHGVVAVSGAIDFVTDGNRQAQVHNGHALMPRVTALGCSLNGIIAAFVASHNDAFLATVAALSYFGLAGEIAAKEAKGPGSFAVRFIDALMQIDSDQLDRMARIELL